MKLSHKHQKGIWVLKLSFLATVPLFTAWYLVGQVSGLGPGPQDRVEAPAAFQAYLGTWQGGVDGQPALTVALKNVGEQIAGSVTFYLYRDGKLADKDEVQLLNPRLQAGALSFSLHEANTCASCHATRRERGLVRDSRYGEVLEFKMRLLGKDQAEVRTLGVAESEFSLLKLTRPN